MLDNVERCLYLNLIHAKYLLSIRGAKLEARHKIDESGDKGSHDKCVSSSCTDVGRLNIEPLDETAVGTCAYSIQCNYSSVGKEGIKQEANYSADAVCRKYINSIVNLQKEFVWRRK